MNQKIPEHTITKQVWIKNRANWNGLKQDLENNMNWNSIFHCESPISNLNQQLMRLCEKHIPKKTLKFREKDKPWFNDECRRVLQLKQTAFGVWRRHRTQENYEIFKNVRQQASRTYANAERSYNESLKNKLQ